MAIELAKAYVQIIPSARDISGKLTELLGGEEAEQAGKSAGATFGSALQAGAKVAAGAIASATDATVDFVGESVKAGMNFDASMSQVAATMGTTTDQIGELRDFAQKMGATTAFSATQAADALNYMALAGYDSNQAMEALPNVLNLAAAGGIDLASASDMVTDAQSALGLSMGESTELVDKMAEASSKSNTSVAQLGSAILTVGGTAKNLAGGTTELSAALGILADNGIKGAEGGTALRNIILSLSAPTDKSAALMKRLGLNAYDADGNLRPLGDTFGDLNDILSDMTQGEQTQVLNTLFNKVDLKSASALLAAATEETEGLGTRFDELSGYIDDAADAAQKMAETQLDNLSGDVTMLQSAFEGAQIAVSDQLTPSLREFVQFGTEGLSRVTEAFKTDGLSGAMEEMGSILSDGLAMIVEKLPEFVDAGAELLGSLVQGIVDNLPQIAETALEIILQLADGLSENLPEIIPAVVEVVLEIVDTLIEHAPDLLDAALEIILALADGLINSLPELIRKIPEIVESIVAGFIENAPKLLEAALELMVTLAAGLIEAIPELLIAIPKIILSMVDGFFDGARQFKDVGKEMISGLWEGIKEKIDWVKERLRESVSSLVEIAKNILGIHSPSRVFAEMGRYMMLGMAEGIEGSETLVADQLNRSLRFHPAIDYALSGFYLPARSTLGAGSEADANVVTAIYAVARELAEVIRNKDMNAYIGDAAVGQAYDRYKTARGVAINRGAFANAY